MAYSEKISNKIRETLAGLTEVEEKEMFGGMCFMVDGKMCMGVIKDEMMCRIDPEDYETALTKKGSREMDFNGRPMKGYVFVSEDGFKSKKDFDHWRRLCLEFNTRAEASKKKTVEKKKNLE